MIYQRKQGPKLATKLLCLVGLPVMTVSLYLSGWAIFAMQHGY